MYTLSYFDFPGSLYRRHVVHVRPVGHRRSVNFNAFLDLLTCPFKPDDTLARKVNTSDASEFARICGCCPSRGVSLSNSNLIYINFPSLGLHLVSSGLHIFRPGCPRGTRSFQSMST